MSLPFLSFDKCHAEVKAEMLEAFEAFYDSGRYMLGERLQQFEQGYATLNQVGHCIGVSNGLDALYLSLKALGIGPGHEVVVPSNSYIATVLAVSFVHATPVLVEPDPRTGNLDPRKVLEKITPYTKAILPIHFYGQCCDMGAIMDIACTYRLYVVEDNAQSHGAAWQGKPAGSWGHVNATSFYPTKNLGALGDAGAITTNDALLAERIKKLRNYGSSKKYHNELIGHNMRLDEVQAAFLSVKLRRLQAWNQARQEIARWYAEALAGVPGLELPYTLPGATHVYHLYVVHHPQRDALQQHLQEQGIGTMIHYPVPPHLQEAYQHLGYKKGDFPIAEHLADTCLSLPIWPGMTKEDVRQVAAAVHSFQPASTPALPASVAAL